MEGGSTGLQMQMQAGRRAKGMHGAHRSLCRALAVTVGARGTRAHPAFNQGSAPAAPLTGSCRR